jgi:hypothetical protein
MKHLWMFFFYMVSSPFAFGSGADTTVMPDLTYHSTLEKKNFETLIKTNQLDTIAFLLGIDSTVSPKTVQNVQKQLQDFYQFVDANADKKKKNLKKWVDYLFENIHARFLKKYQYNIRFDRIFKDGVYNCVTASALYALVFEHYGIPYQLKELPTHVYIVVDPDGSPIVLEPTDPNGQYFAPADAFKKEFVNQLLEAKLVTTAELQNEGVAALFNQHYYKHPNGYLSIRQLVSLLYSNLGIALSEQKEVAKTVEAIEKAYWLYPCERHKNLMSIALHLQMQHMVDDVNLETIKIYIKAFPFFEKAKYKKAITMVFNALAQEMLFRKNQEAEYDQYYQLFISKVTDSATVASLRFEYHTQKAHAAFLKNDYTRAIQHEQICLQVYPDDLATQANLRNHVVKLATNYSNDAQNILDTLDIYAQKYSFLAKNESYATITAAIVLSVAATLCEADNYQKSLPHFERFERLMAVKKSSLSNDIIGIAYGEASSYCIRNQNNYTLGRDWLARGLRYDPKSRTLQRKLQVLDENPLPVIQPRTTPTHSPKPKKKG